MLEEGEAIGQFSAAGQLVASALILPYGERLAWIAMVLTSAELPPPRPRDRQPAAGRSSAAASGGLIAGLDATPDGVEVYRPLGFQDVCGLQRLRAEQPGALTLPRARRGDPPAAGRARPRRDRAPRCAACSAPSAAGCWAISAAASRAARCSPRPTGELAGFVLARAGRIGPAHRPSGRAEPDRRHAPARPGAGRRGGTGLDRRPGPPERASSGCCRAPASSRCARSRAWSGARPRRSATWRAASRSPAPSSARPRIPLSLRCALRGRNAQ